MSVPSTNEDMINAVSLLLTELIVAVRKLNNVDVYNHYTQAKNEAERVRTITDALSEATNTARQVIVAQNPLIGIAVDA